MRNVKEVGDLFSEIQANCPLKISSVYGAYVPLRSGYNSEVEGFTLCINTEVDNQALDCIKSIVEKHKLKYRWITHRNRKVLEIYTPKEA